MSDEIMTVADIEMHSTIAARQKTDALIRSAARMVMQAGMHAKEQGLPRNQIIDAMQKQLDHLCGDEG